MKQINKPRILFLTGMAAGMVLLLIAVLLLVLGGHGDEEDHDTPPASVAVASSDTGEAGKDEAPGTEQAVEQGKEKDSDEVDHDEDKAEAAPRAEADSGDPEFMRPVLESYNRLAEGRSNQVAQARELQKAYGVQIGRSYELLELAQSVQNSTGLPAELILTAVLSTHPPESYKKLAIWKTTVSELLAISRDVDGSDQVLRTYLRRKAGVEP